MKIDFNKAFNSSMNYMSTILFKPFIFRKWLALGFAAILTGYSSGGNIRRAYNFPSDRTPSTDKLSSDISTYLHQYLWLILLGIGAIIVLCFIFT